MEPILGFGEGFLEMMVETTFERSCRVSPAKRGAEGVPAWRRVRESALLWMSGHGRCWQGVQDCEFGLRAGEPLGVLNQGRTWM